MSTENKLIRGFTEPESERIGTSLSKLVEHLTPDRFVIVGGLAIRYHLQQAEIPYPPRPFNDLDILAESFDVVHPDIKNDFLVYHVHQRKDSFYFAFVDEESRTKVDIFDYEKPPGRTLEIPIGNGTVRIVSVEDQLSTTVYDLQRISEKAKVDPKQFLDATLLSQIADMEVADTEWKRRRTREHPESIVDAIQRAEEIRREHPEWTQQSPFKKPKPYQCPDCIQSEQFPLDSMGKIYEILGIVE